jgi:hypothetical protein
LPADNLPFDGTGAARNITRKAALTPNRAAAASNTPRPHWNAAQRELWYAGQLVKRFRVRAANQELILAAFEEEGWPARVDDPLPGLAKLVLAKIRLRVQIERLNGAHATPGLLRFRGDGTGQGIVWQALKSR